MNLFENLRRKYAYDAPDFKRRSRDSGRWEE